MVVDPKAFVKEVEETSLLSNIFLSYREQRMITKKNGLRTAI